MTRTYHDNCHRGAVRCEADLDLAAGTGRNAASLISTMAIEGAS